MKKLGVVITDGVGFRNYLLSDFMQEAVQQFDEVVILSYLPHTAYIDLKLSVRVIELEALEENFFQWFFRKSKEVAHLKKHQKGNYGIQDNLQTNTTKAMTSRGIATRLIFRFTHFFHSERWIQRYYNWQQLCFKNHRITKNYEAILTRERFSHLFFTHQRPPFIAPLAYRAQKQKITTSTFIFSWDNLASKGRMAANFDYYLVWSKLMKQDLKSFYEKVKEHQIAIVGTPQFEPYVLSRYETSEEAFYTKFQLKKEFPTICFSCGDSSTSKNDELYIQSIAKAIEVKKIPKANLLVRTSPAEDPIRFKNLVSEFPWIQWNFPKWELSRSSHQESWSQRIPSIEDVKDLRAILMYSTLNVNMLSTMSLDFMQFNKPVVNPVFGNKSNGLYDDQRFLKYAHIEHVIQSGATQVALDEASLITAIAQYLAQPDLHATQRQKLIDLEIGLPLHGTSARIAETLYQWS